MIDVSLVIFSFYTVSNRIVACRIIFSRLSNSLLRATRSALHFMRLYRRLTPTCGGVRTDFSRSHAEVSGHQRRCCPRSRTMACSTPPAGSGHRTSNVPLSVDLVQTRINHHDHSSTREVQRFPAHPRRRRAPRSRYPV